MQRATLVDNPEGRFGQVQRTKLLLPKADLRCCTECGGQRVMDGKELVCEQCGVVLDVRDPYIGVEKYGRAPQSFGVLGDNLGSAMSTRMSNGLSDLYALRGAGVVDDIMPGYLAGIEEPNITVANLKQKVVPALKNASSCNGKMTTGDSGTEISEGTKWWFKEAEELSSKNRKCCATQYTPNFEDQVLLFKADWDKYCKLLLSKKVSPLRRK